MKRRVIGRGSAAASRRTGSYAPNATRHRPPTRRAGILPKAIHRCTDRVVAPIRRAYSLGLISSDIVARLSHTAYGPRRPSVEVGRPGGSSLLGEGAEAFLRLGAR